MNKTEIDGAVTLTVDAAVENLPVVQDFIEGGLERVGCPMKIISQISVAAEEIYVNIALYAYSPGTGDATVSFSAGDGCAVISFSDSGRPFDPLARPDADITLPAEERQIGGLGILMVKRMMDGVSYVRRDGMNILTIKKKLL